MINKLTCNIFLSTKTVPLNPKVEQAILVPKPIIHTAKALQFLSTKLTTLFAAKLFTTPIKHKIPKRELEMDKNSNQELLPIPSINKEVVVYHYGKSDKKILLVHGWSGRGTQLVKFADELLKLGYSTISFDAPAHGKSPGKSTLMTDFIASALEIEKHYGPFEAAIGHSLGGMTLLNSVKRGLPLKKLAIIGSGDKVSAIMDDFVSKLELKPEISDRLRMHFENKFGETMESYSSYIAAKEVEISVLIVHDENDYEVSVEAAKHIHKHLKNGKIVLTKGLGHRKILGNKQVIGEVIDFITH